MPDAGRMDLDAKIVPFGMKPGHFREGVAVTEPDFEEYRMIVPEHLFKIERVCLIIQSPCRPIFFEGTLLPGSQASAAQHIATDRTMLRAVRLG